MVNIPESPFSCTFPVYDGAVAQKLICPPFRGLCCSAWPHIASQVLLHSGGCTCASKRLVGSRLFLQLMFAGGNADHANTAREK